MKSRLSPLPAPEPGPGERHQPVLLAEVLACLAVRPGERVLDCTLGLGGHSEALLSNGASLVGVDRDPQARALAAQRLSRFGDRFNVRGGTFADAAAELAAAGERFSAVLADLGVSSMQIDDEGRGFGIRSGAAADMRMGDGCAQTALQLIEQTDENDLADIIYRYGEERLSRRIARALKTAQRAGALASAADVATVVRKVVPGHSPRHPAQRTFQALRIAVNDELGQLDRLLALLPDLLLPGGRAAIISFHSLEDRAVKTAFRAGLADHRYSAISKRVVVAGDDELQTNHRASAAKLRWAMRAPRGET